jgi:hypothetical protein
MAERPTSLHIIGRVEASTRASDQEVVQPGTSNALKAHAGEIWLDKAGGWVRRIVAIYYFI